MLRKKGFTLVEIMIVVAIIGLLAAIAIPNFVGARNSARKQACIANLKTIEGAKQVWALENNQADTAIPAFTVLTGGNFLRSEPVCPSGGSYNVLAVSANPECADHKTNLGHALPD